MATWIVFFGILAVALASSVPKDKVTTIPQPPSSTPTPSPGQYRVESQGQDGSVSGQYGYQSPEGSNVHVSYNTGGLKPQPSAAPIQPSSSYSTSGSSNGEVNVVNSENAVQDTPGHQVPNIEAMMKTILPYMYPLLQQGVIPSTDTIQQYYPTYIPQGDGNMYPSSTYGPYSYSGFYNAYSYPGYYSHYGHQLHPYGQYYGSQLLGHTSPVGQQYNSLRGQQYTASRGQPQGVTGGHQYGASIQQYTAQGTQPYGAQRGQKYGVQPGQQYSAMIGQPSDNKASQSSQPYFSVQANQLLQAFPFLAAYQQLYGAANKPLGQQYGHYAIPNVAPYQQAYSSLQKPITNPYNAYSYFIHGGYPLPYNYYPGYNKYYGGYYPLSNQVQSSY